MPPHPIDLTVLIVDDNEQIQRLLNTFITSLGYSSVVAANGVEALEYCRAVRPDVILMDVLMPEMDGYEATAALRKLFVNEWIPIIFLTALNDQVNLVKGLEIGGDDYLLKPVDLSLLKAKINVLLRINQLQKRVLADSKRLELYYEESEQEQRLARHILARFNSQPVELQRHVQQWLNPAVKFNGDVISVERSPKGNIHMMLADSTGNGLTAAICCLPAVSAFVSMTKRGFDINTIAREINDRTHNRLPTGRFVAAALVSIDYMERTVSVWNGGVPCVFFMNAHGSLEKQFHSAYPPLGIASDDTFDAALEVYPWEQDGQLIIASDGVTGATNNSGESFALEGVLTATRDARMANTVDAIAQAMVKHLGKEHSHDDASLIIVDCTQANANCLPELPASSRLSHTVSVNWEIKLSFTAEQLREHDCFQAIVGWLNQVGLEQNQFGAVLLILSELFNNALDHGVLGLSSSLKNSEGGFEKYLGQRQEKLQNLTEGEISIGLSRAQPKASDPHSKLQLWLTDTGKGFDYSKRIQQSEDGNDNTGDQVHGRGISLIASMSESIRYVGAGNRVEVVFAL